MSTTPLFAGGGGEGRSCDNFLGATNPEFDMRLPGDVHSQMFEKKPFWENGDDIQGFLTTSCVCSTLKYEFGDNSNKIGSVVLALTLGTHNIL